MVYHTSELSVFLATPEQTLTTRIRAAEAWKGPRTLEQYLAREEALERCEHALHGRSATWVLAPIANPETLEFLSSCKTFRRDILWSGPSSGVVLSGTAYIVTFVFTPKHERRKGYGRHLMRLLHWILASEAYLGGLVFPPDWGTRPSVPPGFGNGALSVLYSAIGDKFYQASGPTEIIDGWHLEPFHEDTFHVADLIDVLQEKPKSTARNDIRWLDEVAARQVWQRDEQIISHDIAREPASPRFAFSPHNGVAAYPFQRILLDTSSRIEGLEWGVEITSDPEQLVFATWAPGPMVVPPEERAMVLTRLRCGRDAFPVLMRSVSECAARQKPPIEKIQIWNLPEHLTDISEELGGTRVLRSRHLSMLMTYNVPVQTVWLFNEK